jgi:hypothetical protein
MNFLHELVPPPWDRKKRYWYSAVLSKRRRNRGVSANHMASPTNWMEQESNDVLLLP